MELIRSRRFLSGKGGWEGFFFGKIGKTRRFFWKMVNIYGSDTAVLPNRSFHYVLWKKREKTLIPKFQPNDYDEKSEYTYRLISWVWLCFSQRTCVFFGKKQEKRGAFFDFWQRYMAETNRDAEMQIGSRNGANMPFAQKNRKNEPLVGSCFTQCSAFWKDTLKNRDGVCHWFRP